MTDKIVESEHGWWFEMWKRIKNGEVLVPIVLDYKGKPVKESK